MVQTSVQAGLARATMLAWLGIFMVSPVSHAKSYAVPEELALSELATESALNPPAHPAEHPIHHANIIANIILELKPSVFQQALRNPEIARAMTSNVSLPRALYFQNEIFVALGTLRAQSPYWTPAFDKLNMGPFVQIESSSAQVLFQPSQNHPAITLRWRWTAHAPDVRAYPRQVSRLWFEPAHHASSSGVALPPLFLRVGAAGSYAHYQPRVRHLLRAFPENAARLVSDQDLSGLVSRVSTDETAVQPADRIEVTDF